MGLEEEHLMFYKTYVPGLALKDSEAMTTSLIKYYSYCK